MEKWRLISTTLNLKVMEANAQLRRSIPWESARRIHCIGGAICPGASLDVTEKRRISFPEPSAVQSQYRLTLWSLVGTPTSVRT